MSARRMPGSAAGLLAAALLTSACSALAADLAQERARFQTTVHVPSTGQGPVPRAPARVFDTVAYPSAAGLLGAYLTPDPRDGKRHPAIVWITGGDYASIGDVWSPARRDNDQTAAAYRQAGIAMMFPSLRGGNTNPGRRELFYGEADDILAAADFLARQPWVDPDRIYLGGHSTGGTMALLTAEQTARFRAVFAFGPVVDVREYGRDLVPVDFARLDARETTLRRAVDWLPSVRRPLFVIEGLARGNVDDLHDFEHANRNPLIHVMGVPGATHFTDLAPANEVIAAKILADTGASCNISITPDEIVARMR